MDLPADERMTFCQSKIDSKQEEIDDLRKVGGLPARERNLQRQISNYQTIQMCLTDSDCNNEFLASIISSMKKEDAKNSITGKEEVDHNLNKAIQLSLKLENEKKPPAFEVDGGAPKEEVIEAGKYLKSVMYKNFNTLQIGELQYGKLQERINSLLKCQKELGDEKGNFAKQLAALKNIEKKFDDKLEEMFPFKARVDALRGEFGMSEELAGITLILLSFEDWPHLKNADVKEALYK